MGADLYILSVTNKADEENKPSFDAAIAARDKYQAEHPLSEKEQRAYNDWQWEDGGTDGVPAKYIKLQKEVGKYYDAMFPSEGYFRDSYNHSSLFWRIRLSWWTDVIPMCDDEGMLLLDGIKDLKVMVAEAWEAREPLTLEELQEGHCEVKGEDPLGEWRKYYEDKYRNFMCFLANALRLEEPISCSL